MGNDPLVQASLDRQSRRAFGTTPTDSGIVTDGGLVKNARAILAKHLRHLNDAKGADEMERGDWDRGADMKALVEVLRTLAHERKRIGELEAAANTALGNIMNVRIGLETGTKKLDAINDLDQAAIRLRASLSQRPTDGADR